MQEDRHIIHSLSTLPDSVTSRALRAALTLFARHGLTRTSMADVAEMAGISRATLYVHFKDKLALFDGLAEIVVREALRDMHEAWRPDDAFGQNLAAAILAKDLPFHRLTHTSPHGGDLLLATTSRSVDARSSILEADFIAFIHSRAVEQASTGRRFDAFEGVEAFAKFVSGAAAGFKATIAVEEHYRSAIRTFARVLDIATLARAETEPSEAKPTLG